MESHNGYDTQIARQAISLLHRPGEVFEIRIPRARRSGTVSGYFDDAEAAAAALASYDGRVPGIYLTLNPVRPPANAGALNRLEELVHTTSADRDILRRRALLIDVDYQRPSGTSATDEELESCLAVAQRIRLFLEDECGWPEGAAVMSGNGAHLFYRIDLANDEAGRDLVKRLLTALAARFDEGGLHVDTGVYNAARIVKVPGTMACKGENLAERPHRRSRVLSAPVELETVSDALLEKVAGLALGLGSSTGGVPEGPWFDVEAFIERNGLEVRKVKRDESGDLYELATCPFNSDHNRGEAFILQLPNGALSAGCHHDSCTWGWRQLRDEYERGSDQSQDDSGRFEAELARLAALSETAYERERIQAAKELGMRVTRLDKLVSARRHSRSHSGELFPDEPEPYPDEVDGEDLLNELCAVIRRHVWLPPGAAEGMALWCVHAHAHDAADISPILGITSPTPECGKTVAMTFLGAVVPRALPASNITAAAVFRTMDRYSPTLLIDEADTFLNDNDELRGVLNCGHARRSASIVRTVGEDHEPARFSTWAPKAIAMIGKLPATLASRSVHVRLQRKTQGEDVMPLRLHQLDELLPLRRKMARWALDHLEVLRLHEPYIPPGFGNRLADNWRPLLAIAEVVGGSWPERARNSALLLSGAAEEETAGIMVLEDLRTLFEAHDRLSTQEILAALNAMDERPWPEWSRGRELSPAGLARLLKPFGIRPRSIREGENCNHKGYLREQFEDAFDRYLPATPPQCADETVEAMGSPATPDGSVAAPSLTEVASEATRGGVAERTDGGGLGIGRGPAIAEMSESAREVTARVHSAGFGMVVRGEEIKLLTRHTYEGCRLPRGVRSRVQKCKEELLARLRWEASARTAMHGSMNRVSSILAEAGPEYNLYDKGVPRWDSYQRRLEEAFAAGDGERIMALLEDRECFARFLCDT